MDEKITELAELVEKYVPFEHATLTDIEFWLAYEAQKNDLILGEDPKDIAEWFNEEWFAHNF